MWLVDCGPCMCVCCCVSVHIVRTSKTMCPITRYLQLHSHGTYVQCSMHTHTKQNEHNPCIHTTSERIRYNNNKNSHPAAAAADDCDHKNIYLFTSPFSAQRRNIVSARVQWFSSSWLNGDKWSLVYIFCQFVIFQRQMVTKSNIFHIGNCRIHAVQQSRSNDQPQVYRRTLSGSLCCNALQKMHSRRT